MIHGSFTLVMFFGKNVGDSNKDVLNLATLGNMTKIETILSYVTPPKVTMASKEAATLRATLKKMKRLHK